MMFAEPQAASTIGSGMTTPEEARTVGREVWEAIRRMAQQDGLGVSELAHRFDLDRKTVRPCCGRWRGVSEGGDDR